MQNPFVLKAEASRSIYDDPLQKFKFQVTMAGMPAGAGFSKVGGTSDEVDVIEYCEGMWDNIHKLPGRNKIGTLDFERGMYASRDAEIMLLATRTNPSMRQTMLVEIKNRYGETKRKYQLAEAWVSKVQLSDLDAKSGDVAIEKMTVAFEYFLGTVA